MTLIVVLAWAAGSFEGRSFWQITGLDLVWQCVSDRPACEKRQAEEAVRQAKAEREDREIRERLAARMREHEKERARVAAVHELKEDAAELKKLTADWFAPWSLPRRCSLEPGPLAQRVDAYVEKYGKLLARWDAIPTNKATGDIGNRERTERYLMERIRHWAPSTGLFGLQGTVEELADETFASSRYYPLEPPVIRRALVAYLEGLCVTKENTWPR
jgi:hypothetical protein